MKAVMKIYRQLVFLIFILLVWTNISHGYDIVNLSPTYFPESVRSRAISNGEIYVGLPDTDPEVPGNQKQLYVRQENGTIVSVSQPIYTSTGGMPLYNGSVVTLLTVGDYSLKILDSHGDQVYYVPLSEISTIENIFYPEDFGTVDGVNDEVQINLALTAAKNRGAVQLTASSYTVNAPIVFPTDGIDTKLFSENGSYISVEHTGNGIVLTGINENYGHFIVENITIDGPNTHYPSSGSYVPTSTGAGLVFNTSYKCVIRDCVIEGFLYGVSFTGGNIMNRFVGKNLIRFNQHGIYFEEGTSNVNIFDGVEIRENRLRGITCNATGGGPYPTGNVFTNYLIETNVPYEGGYVAPAGDGSDSVGVYLENGYNFKFTNGYHENHEFSFIITQGDDNKFNTLEFVPGGSGRIEKVWLKGAATINNTFKNIINVIADTTTPNVISDDSKQTGNQFIDCVGFNFIEGSMSAFDRIDIINCGKYSTTGGTVYGFYPSATWAGYQENPSEGTDRGQIDGIGTSSATFNAQGISDVMLGNTITGETTFDEITNLKGGQFITFLNYQQTYPINFKSDTDGITSDGFMLDGRGTVTLRNYSDSVTFYRSHFGRTYMIGKQQMKGDIFTGSGLWEIGVQGGAAGNYALGQIPNNATVTRAWYEVGQGLTSSGTTSVRIGVSTDDVNGIVTLTDSGDAIWVNGYHDATPDGSAANFTTKATNDRDLQLTISGDALTTGKIRVWYEFVVSD